MAVKSAKRPYGCRAAMLLIAEQFGEFTPTAELHLKHHIHHCPNCTAFLQSLRTTIELYRHWYLAPRPGILLNVDFFKPLKSR